MTKLGQANDMLTWCFPMYRRWRTRRQFGKPISANHSVKLSIFDHYCRLHLHIGRPKWVRTASTGHLRYFCGADSCKVPLISRSRKLGDLDDRLSHGLFAPHRFSLRFTPISQCTHAPAVSTKTAVRNS